MIPGMTQGTLKWKLFPFSLKERARQWYDRTVGSANGEWEKLRDSFCLAFFPLSRVASLRSEVLNFRQKEKETLGAACIRFLTLIQTGPDLSLPDHVILLHFQSGLNKKSALHLDAWSGGSFSNKTPAEGRVILNRIKATSSVDDYPEPPSREDKARTEEPSTAEPDPLPCIPLDLAVEPSPEPRVPKEEEIQPSEFPFEFEGDISADFENTSNHFSAKNPPIPVAPPVPLENDSLWERIMKDEWLHEEELSYDVLQINSPPSIIHSNTWGTLVEDQNDDVKLRREAFSIHSFIEPSPKHEPIMEAMVVSSFGPPNSVLEQQSHHFTPDDFGEALDLVEREQPSHVDYPDAPTLESEQELCKHESFFLEEPQDACLHHTSLELDILSAISSHESYNLLKHLFGKIFRRMVVDAYVYHKYCKSRGCIFGTNIAA